MLGEGPLSSPKEFLRRHSDMVDGLVRAAFRSAQSGFPSPSVCLTAVGGYGRAELAPYSDVDLLLLHSPASRSELSPLIERTLYPLWDLGLEVTCSSRSIPECLQMARSDLLVKTSLIDARYLDGEYGLFRGLYELFTRKVLHQNVKAFAQSLMKDLRARRQKNEDPAYVLEPNLKEGEGGLRDFQIGRWAIRAKYKTDRWDNILFPDHSRPLENSVQFLWALRNQTHLFSDRKEDHLTFELQEKIAPVMGFAQGTAGIEEMMKQYHISSQRISNFARDIVERILSEPSPFKRAVLYLKPGKRLDRNFGMSHGEVHLLDPMLLKSNPSTLLTLFQYCQIHRAKMDFRTEEAVIESLPFLDDGLGHSEGIHVFLSILGQEGAAAVLRKMHGLGFLSRYIPEFSHLEGKVHYDLYHVHPVDVHSILAVEELEKLRMGAYEKEYPLLTSLMREIEKPEILLLTALLHDVGKGKEGDHSVLGAELVDTIAQRMRIPDGDRSYMAFVIRHHLFMLETAFRRDLDDEQAIAAFATRVRSISRLKMLYLLTFADVRAVGPDSWSEWKNSLLMDLFLKAARYLGKDGQATFVPLQEEALKRVEALLSREVYDAYATYLPARYLSSYSAEQIALHVDMARSLQGETLSVRWNINDRDRADVTVCTKDRYGLFHKITGCMFLNRLNILEAKIHTWGNDIALDTFEVDDSTADIERRLLRFNEDLKKVLHQEVTLKDLVCQDRGTKGIEAKVVPAVDAEARINNRDSDFYTIVEITGQDRLGILHDITETLTDHGCNIHFAKVSTLGNRIVDVFYIQDALGEKLEEQGKVDQLRNALLRALASPRKERCQDTPVHPHVYHSPD
jgi:[protein-PII] uridylyltransferase